MEYRSEMLRFTQIVTQKNYVGENFLYKDITFLTYRDKRQFWLYLQGSKYKISLLINFGTKKLEIERRIYDRARSKISRYSASLST